jgi:N-acetyltransferase 10
VYPALLLLSGADEDLAAATGGKVPASGGLVSVRSTGKAAAASGTGAGQQGGKGKDGKKDGGLMYARKDKHKGGGGKKHGGGGGKKPKH